MISMRRRALIWILVATFGMIYPVGVCRADQPVKYQASGKRDPFIPLVTSGMRETNSLLTVDSVDQITIQGIIYDPGHGSMVIANGVPLKEGEESGNAKLVTVSPTSAVFLVNGIEGTKEIYPEGSAKKGID